MTKDFKKQAVSSNAFGQYGLGWMVGGVAIGLLVGAGMYALANKGNTSAATAPTTTHNPTASLGDAPDLASAGTTIEAASLPDNVVEPDDSGNMMPGFSYHAVLPQLEIDVPLSVPAEQPAATKKAPPPPKDDAKPSTKLSGMNGLQVGSYKTQAQATDMQNRLQKKGLNSRIEPANVQGVTWFRVRIGPAASSEVLQQWQQTLSGMGISPMAIRM